MYILEHMDHRQNFEDKISKRWLGRPPQGRLCLTPCTPPTWATPVLSQQPTNDEHVNVEHFMVRRKEKGFKAQCRKPTQT